MINITVELSVESLSLYSDRPGGRVLDTLTDENFDERRNIFVLSTSVLWDV